jgi:hypothetical protein
MKKSQFLFWLLLLPLFTYAQRRSGKESPHSLAVSFGVPVIHKSKITDYILPLSFIYEYSKKKNTFGVGLQLSYGHKNFVNNIRDSNEMVAEIKRLESKAIVGSFAAFRDFFIYDLNDDYFNTNIPIYFRRTLSDVSSKIQFFGQIGIVPNINIWYQKITHFPLLKQSSTTYKFSIEDLKPQERFESSASFRPISTDVTIGGGFKYNLSKNQSLFGILQYEYSFDAYSNGQKVNLYLGYSFKI